MKFSLIVCIYASRTVAKTLAVGTAANRISNEILIIDGSKDDATQTVSAIFFDNLKYFKVLENERD
jgi:hypothetical protein